MADTIFSWKTEVSEANFRALSYLDEVAETIRDDAITLAREKLGAARCGANLGRLLGQSLFFDYFKHGLAIGVVNVLAASDWNVQAVHIYDPTHNPGNDAGEDLQDATLHLIIELVAQPNVALESLMADLDQALAATVRELPSPRLARRESILDISLVTEEDVRYGLNAAGLLVGLFASPLKIWQRE